MQHDSTLFQYQSETTPVFPVRTPEYACLMHCPTIQKRTGLVRIIFHSSF